MGKRKNFKLGIHFDFHAQDGMTVADIYCPESVERMLDTVKPDFVQCDTKGHAGLSSYPTNIGYRADRIEHDILKMWRELTQKRGIALYAHHSGLFDIKAAAEHPEWAVVDENGNVSNAFMSVFGDYPDKLLIPQIKEIAGKYKLDGVWVDGECWGLQLDYSKKAEMAYFEATGKPLPKQNDDDFENYREFTRNRFKQYIAHYVSEIKKDYPDFEITSNWVFSEFMPEKVSVPVDFLSGDYSAVDSVNCARFAGRCLDAQNMTWDLMAWGQNTTPVSWESVNRQNKPAVQLMQEASVVVALGGCFEFFHILYGHGSYIQEWAIDEWGKVADFVRARQDYCFGSKPVKEIAVILPKHIQPKDAEFLYDNEIVDAKNWIFALQDCGFSTEILFEDSIEELKEYPVIVLPKADNLDKNMQSALLNYVKNGGKLVCDLGSIKYFSDIAKVELNTVQSQMFVNGEGRLAGIETNAVLIPTSSTDAVMFDDNHYLANRYSAYKKVAFSNGKMLFNLFDLGGIYHENKSIEIRSYLKSLLKSIGIEQTANTNYGSNIDITLRKKDGKLLVNLINMLGPHCENGVRSYDFVPPLYDVTVNVKCEKAPEGVVAQPNNTKCDFRYENGVLTINAGRLDIHKVLVIE